MDAEQLFQDVKEKNRVVEGEVVGVQRLNDEVHVFVDDGSEEDAVILNLSVRNARTLQGYLRGSIDD